MKRVLSVVLVIIGTIVGAGFASGKEIEIFFINYGINGILGVVLTSALISLIIYKTIKIVKLKNINNYEDFIDEICDFKNKRIIKDIINAVINIFLLITFLTMMAGFSNYLNQEFNIPMIIGNIVFSIICYITLLRDINGVVKINVVLIPVLILYIIYIGAKNNSVINIENLVNIKSNWFLSSVLYASYNSLVLISVLISIRKKYCKKNDIIRICLILFFSFLIIMLIIFFNVASIHLPNVEIPMIEVSKNLGFLHEYLYGSIIVIAIFTSAISSGYGFLMNISKKRKNYNRLLLVICCMSVILSQIKFSYFIEIMYPFFGFLGLFQIFLIFKNKCSKI